MGLEQNVKAGKASRAAMGLILAGLSGDESAQLDALATFELEADGADLPAFWQRLAELSKAEAGGAPDSPSDLDLIKFEAEKVPFGGDKGKAVRDCELEDLRRFSDWFRAHSRWFTRLDQWLESERAK